jgi:hypothetical protein
MGHAGELRSGAHDAKCCRHELIDHGLNWS